MSTLIIQPSTHDAYIGVAAPDNNYGTDVQLYLCDLQAGKIRDVLSADFSLLPAGVLITQAILQLYYYYYNVINPSGKTVWAYRLTRTNWTFDGVTWNKYNGVNNWTVAGGDYTTTNGASTTFPADFGWMSWDVTALAQYAQANTSEIAHFLLKFDNETKDGVDYSTIKFHSNNYITDTSRCPKLTLTYNLWTGKINGVTNPAKINGVSTQNILKVNGVVSTTV